MSLQPVLERLTEYLKRIPAIVSAILITLLINLFFHWNPFAGFSWRWLLMSLETLLLLWTISLLLDWRNTVPSLLLKFALAILWALRLFGLADQAVPVYFDRTFNLYVDLRYIPDLLDLFWLTSGPVLTILSVLGALAIILIMIWASWKSFRYLTTLLKEPHTRFYFLFFMLAITIASVAAKNLFDYADGRAVNGYASRMIEEIRFISDVRELEQEFRAELSAVQREAEWLPNDLAGLDGNDVLLFFVESYGHASLNHEEYGPLIIPELRRIESSLTEKGFSVVSGYMNSPTYGGTSWLAHGSFSSGVAVHDQLRFDMLLQSDVRAMPKYFNAAGYRTICVMPGTRYAWPEGEWFGYQKKIFADDFDYAGPMYGWSPMPDQFVLDRVYRKHLMNEARPVFAEYVLVSSHAPFHIQPPFVENWHKIGDGNIFHDIPPLRYSIQWPQMENAAEGYSRSIRYVLRSLEEYLIQFVDDDALIIILGDHQPNIALTGPRQPWLVPVHVISRNAGLLSPFIERGYVSGTLPERKRRHSGMETFLPNFLKDYSLDRLAD